MLNAADVSDFNYVYFSISGGGIKNVLRVSDAFRRRADQLFLIRTRKTVLR